MTNETPMPNARAQAAADKAYQKATRPWFKKKRFIIPLVIILMIIMMTAVNGGGTDQAAAPAPAPAASGTVPAPSADASGAPVAAAPPAPTFPGSEPGDVVGQAGAALKLADVTATSTPVTAGKSTPGINAPLLCTTATLSNGSKQTVMFSALDFKLQTPSGAILNTSYFGSDNHLSTGEIAAGGTASGDVCFENKNKEAGQFIVLYEPVFSFFSDRAAWINAV